MTLTELKTNLDNAKSAITGTPMVVFDFLFYINLKTKTYPLFIWDIANITNAVRNLRADNTGLPTALMTVPLYGIKLITPENDTDAAKLAVWDDIESDMLTYLQSGVNALDNVHVTNIDAMPVADYYPAGMLSVDREMGVLYNVNLQLWC